MSQPISLEMIQKVVKYYEKLIEDYPNCKDLDKTLEEWKQKEKEFNKNK